MEKYKTNAIYPNEKIYGLFILNSDDESTYILAISYDTNLLSSYMKSYINLTDKENCWICPIIIYELAEIPFVNKIINFIKKNKKSDFEIIQKDFLLGNNYNIYCYQKTKTTSDGYFIFEQNLLFVNKQFNKKIANSNKNKYILDGHIPEHAIFFDKYYPESIGLSNHM